MNLAFNTVILFILVLFPGVVFRRFYYSGPFSQQFIKTNAFQFFVATIIPGILCLLCHYLLVSKLCNICIDKECLAVLFKECNRTEFIVAIKKIERSIPLVVLFNITLWVSAAFWGVCLRAIIRKRKLDLKYNIFRFENRWHYVLSGEIFDFPDVEGQSKDIDLILIKALVIADNRRLVYTGFLADYFLTKEGTGLDQILLTDVEVIHLDEVKENSRLILDRFIIPYNLIINMAIEYWAVQDNESDFEIEPVTS